MKQWIGKQCWIVAFSAMVSLPAAAQEDELKDLPGYVDFGELESVYGEPRVMINIGGMLLQLASGFSHGHPETAEMLRELQGVRINIYSTEGQANPALDQVNRVKGLLKAASWEPIVVVNEADEQVQIYMKADGEGMQGLTVMAVDDEEAVFVNLLGSIDPKNIGKLMENFNVDVDID